MVTEPDNEGPSCHKHHGAGLQENEDMAGCNMTCAVFHCRQGSTAPSEPPGAEPFAPAGRRAAGRSPLQNFF